MRMSLESQQRLFFRAARGQVAASELDVAFRSRGSLSGAARMRVYNHAYFGRLEVALLHVYPLCRRLLGEARFTSCARRYIMAAPATQPDIDRFGSDFPGFLARHGEPPRVVDVAALEWAHVAALLAPPGPVVHLLPAQAGGELRRARFCWVSSLSRLACRRDAFDVLREHEAGEGGGAAALQVAVWRKGFRAHHRVLDRDESELLARHPAPSVADVSAFFAGSSGALKKTYTVVGRWLRDGWVASVALLSLALVACGSDPAGPGTDMQQQGGYGFETGAEMAPGQNCRSCHGAPSSPYPEAPDWSIAGTVFTGPDSDEGAEGVTVLVKDASGAEHRALTNRVGNFHLATPIMAPYAVSLVRGDVSVTMAVPPPAGGCNACHARTPIGGAPGRLFLPESGDFASAAECDGQQTVTVRGAQYDCAPYRCDPVEGACLRGCDGPDDCVAGAACTDGICVAP
jgi:hypothetical protein